MPTMIGLDIGSSAVRAIQLRQGGRGLTLERVGQVQLPAGAVRDGEVSDAETVTEALRALWSRYGFKGRKVALGVANQQVVVRQVDLPYLPDDELRESLQFQAQDYIPIPIDQAVLDFNTVETFETEDGERTSRVLLVAAQREMIDALVRAVREARLDPVLIDLNAFALLRSLAPEGAVDGGDSELLVNIGASVTNIVVHDRGIPRFVRFLLNGGQAITSALTGLGMDFEEAENAKATIRIGPDALADETHRLVNERGERLVEDIRDSVDYHMAQSAGEPIRRAVISGGGSELPGLQERLSDALRLPIDRGHPFQELRIGKVGLDQDQLVEAEPFVAVAVGLAMGALE